MQIYLILIRIVVVFCHRFVTDAIEYTTTCVDGSVDALGRVRMLRWTCDTGRAHEYMSLEIGRGHTNGSTQCHNILTNAWWLGYVRVTKAF